MKLLRLCFLFVFLGALILFSSCKKEETAAEKAKKGWKQLGDAAKQAAEDAKEKIDEATE